MRKGAKGRGHKTALHSVKQPTVPLTFIIPNKILRILLVLLYILWPRSGHKILKVYIYRTENDTCVICGTIKVKGGILRVYRYAVVSPQVPLTFIIPNKIRRILLVLLDILWPLRGHKILKVYIYRTEMTHVSFAVR